MAWLIAAVVLILAVGQLAGAFKAIMEVLPTRTRDRASIPNQSETLPVQPSSSPNTSGVVLEVNGLRGVVTIRKGDPYIYAWRAIGQTSCAIISPFPSGSTLAGTSSEVFPGESFYYPTSGQPGITVKPAPDVVVFDAIGTLRAMLECKGANDGGTARDKAARFRALRDEATRLGASRCLPCWQGWAGLEPLMPLGL